MPIIHITGPAKSGKSLLANSMRNTQIAAGKGALLVDDTQDGEARYLLEKIIAGESLDELRAAEEIAWKPEPVIIVVGKKAKILDEFEKLAPGFLKMFGPVRTMDLASA